MREINGRDCTVCVRSKQWGADGEKQIMETKSEGRLSEREGVLYVLYTENMEEAVDGPPAKVKNLLKIEKEAACVELKKSGAVSWKMRFEAGKSDRAEYETPYGALEISARTREVTVKSGHKKTSLRLLYTLFIQGEKQADCRLEIEIF